MSIFRVDHSKEKPYTQISRKTLQDNNLSLEAIGLLVRLLSKPSDWFLRTTQLCKEMNVGKDRMQRIIKELIVNRYAIRHMVQNPHNKSFTCMEYLIFEEKLSPEEIQVKTEELKKCSPQPEKPAPGFPAPANPPLHNKEVIHNKKTNKKEKGGGFFYSDEFKQRLKDFGLHGITIGKAQSLYDQESAEHALEYCKTIPPNKDLSSQFMWACKAKPEIQVRQKKLTPYEKLCKIFKHGEKYNGAECFLKPEVIAFERGMTQAEVKLNQYFKWDKVEDLCNMFQIDISTKQNPILQQSPGNDDV